MVAGNSTDVPVNDWVRGGSEAVAIGIVAAGADVVTGTFH